MTKPTTKTRGETRSATITRLLSRRTGADLKALQDATGWQPHSVRAALSMLRKTGYVIDLSPPKTGDTGGVYRITAVPENA